MIKHGTPIMNRGLGGDFYARDVSTSSNASLTAESPTAGSWYIDVVAGWSSAEIGHYTLRVI